MVRSETVEQPVAFGDYLNLIDLAGSSFACAALGVRIGSGVVPPRPRAQIIERSSSGSSRCRLSPSTGPLVLMVFRMLRHDVFKWLQVLFVIILSFSNALYVLQARRTVGLDLSGEDLGSGVILLGCVQPARFTTTAGPTHGKTRLPARPSLKRGSVSLAYMVQVVALLLINMLIAMMGKTFDKYEAQALNLYMFLFCQTVTTWHEVPPPPPPLN